MILSLRAITPTPTRRSRFWSTIEQHRAPETARRRAKWDSNRPALRNCLTTNRHPLRPDKGRLSRCGQDAPSCLFLKIESGYTEP